MKEYNSEKAIISLTSWKKRINTVSKTIFSLLKQCPGFHIVLVLSEDEFPEKENELPEDLIFLSENFEILWVKENIKVFKKVLPTMEKYKDVPIISADDGCFYLKNFAEELYQVWLNNKNSIIANTQYCHYYIPVAGGGSGVLYPPYCFKEWTTNIPDFVLQSNHDDGWFGVLAFYLKIPIIFRYKKNHYNLGIYQNFENEEKNGLTKTHSFKNNVIKQFKKYFNL